MLHHKPRNAPMCFIVNHFFSHKKAHKAHKNQNEKRSNDSLCALCAFLWLINAFAEAEATEFSVEGWAMVVEDLGGLFDVAAGAFEGLRDRFALDVFFC